MIKLSDTVKEIIDSQLLNFFYLVSINDDMRYTSAPYDIQMQDGYTYSADAGLTGVEPPRISSTVDRATYKIAFADPSQSLKSYFEEGATGDSVTVRVGFFNTLNRTVDGTPQGEHFKQISNTIVVYKGVIDTQTFVMNFSEESIIASVECSSPMADLDLVRAFYTNKDSMRSRNNTDTAFDQVFDGSEEIALKWGKD